MNITPTSRRRLAAPLLLGAAGAAHAACGSAFCTLLNDRFALGTWDHVGWSADVRVDYVSQTQLRSGTRSINANEVSGEDAVERHTYNTNVVTTLERSFDMNWSLALRVPVVKRDHLHDLIDEDTGAPGASESWRFTRLGDVELLARWQDTRRSPETSWAISGGLKLPTGSFDVSNDDGVRAERSLQPGSGTTDLIVGVAWRQLLAASDALNAQATWVQPLNSREQFKPGRRLELAAGWSHAFNPTVSGVLQASVVDKARDSGEQAEPENSGGTFVSLSPGINVAVGARGVLYGYLQVPLYQRVNGIQLVPKTSFALGYTTSF
ncbi:MAG TPA: transporter [Burkholderiaceae bacterium]|nr:transporter [Burkholderiaceae bacterium]